MTYDQHLRLESLASLALMSDASGTKAGWRPYIENEMKTAGLTTQELREEIARQRAMNANGGK